MKPNPMGQSLLVAMIAGLLFVEMTGCGGGKDDPTKVALRPNKEDAKGGSAGPGAKTKDDGSPPEAKAGFGGITGRIVVEGGAPPEGILYAVGKAPVNPEFCAAKDPIKNQSLIVSSGGGLKNTFFYLEKKPKGGKAEIASQSSWPTAAEADGKLTLDQVNCTYEPHAMIVIAGQEFMAQSQDTVVHSYKGSPLSSGSFNITIPAAPPGGKGVATPVNVFKKPEKSPVPISCATHSWMSGYQLPLDHPYAAVTDADGKFTISDLPSGSHTFKIWHEKGGTLRDYDVDVKADETVDLGDITIRLSQLNK